MGNQNHRLEKLLTTKDIAGWLGYTEQYVRLLANHHDEAKRIPCRRMGPKSQMLFIESEVKDWLDAQRYDRKFANSDHQ